MFVLGVVNTEWPLILSEKSDVYKRFYFVVSRRRTGLSEGDKEETVIKMWFLSLQNCLTDSFYRLLTFAGTSVSDGPGHVSVKALLAVVAVATCRVVATVHAHAAALPPRQLIQLHVEPTAAGMEVAVARCRRKRVHAVSCVNALADYEKSETLFSGKFPAV